MRVSDLRYLAGTARRERARVAFYRRFVARGELAFDVGAHVGERTALLVRAGARVVAVEPQPALRDKLERAFGTEPNVTVVAAAAGADSGEATLRWPSGGLALASMAGDWVDRVRASGRFGGEWTDSVTVPVTTLDLLIERFGLPVFCKIDVEGYEEVVLRGLSSPIRAISLEFTPEYLDATDRSLLHLAELGDYRFDYALGDVLELVERRWMTRDELLSRLRDHVEGVGDVYARLTS